VWWHTPVILAPWRPRQKDHEFEAILGYIIRSCLAKILFLGEIECTPAILFCVPHKIKNSFKFWELKSIS
jgi:hypothetical protein